MKECRIAAAQICPEIGSIKENTEKHLQYMQKAAKAQARLLVFPEASLSGYSSAEAEEIAIEAAAPSLETIRQESRRLNLAVCFGYIERRENHLYLTQELYAAGESIRYRKTHLGARERAVFTAGEEFPTMELLLGSEEPLQDKAAKAAAVCAGMQLCWESHIPEISSAEREKGAELLLVPYASGMSGEKTLENWNVHLPARASDNGVFLIACNLLFRSEEKEDTKQSGEYKGGGIAVYDPKGKRIACSGETTEQMVFCEIGGVLPRELPDGDMHTISYFDRKRKELFN